MKRTLMLLVCCVILLAGLIVPAKADLYDDLRQQMKDSFYSDEMLDVSEYQMTMEELQSIYDELYHNGELPWYAAEDCRYVYSQNQTMAKFRPKVLPESVYIRDTYEIKLAELIQDTCLEGMEDWQIALSVHDYLTSHVRYDETLKKNTGYDALVNGTAACYGYAKLYMDVMNRVGIPCKIAVCRDTGDGYGHAWNVVQIDGSWYHVDATWDDPVPDLYGYGSHLYFLRTDAQFQDPAWYRGFYWEETEKCTDTTYAEEQLWEELYIPVQFLDADTIILRQEQKNRNQIYTMKLSTGETKTLLSFKRQVLNLGKGSYYYPTAGISVWNGRVYYNTETKVYSMNPDGTDIQVEYSYPAKKNKKYIYSLFVDEGVIHLTLANHWLNEFDDLDVLMEGYEPHEHHFSERITLATCQEEGFSQMECDCGLAYGQKVIGKTSHLMLSEVLEVATEEAPGTIRHYCADCDYEERETIPALPKPEPPEEPSIWETLFGWLW